MKTQLPLRILHTPSNIAGNPSSLAEAERSIGLRSQLIFFDKSKYTSCRNSDIFFKTYPFFPPYEYVLKLCLLVGALFKFDVIHYNNGSTLFSPPKCFYPTDSILKKALKLFFNISFGWFYNLDLKIFKIFGKKIIVTFQGSDGRLCKYHLENYQTTHFRYSKKIEIELKKDFEKIRKIKIFSKYANTIFALNPDLLHTLPPISKFLPYANINIQAWKSDKKIKKIQKILHAPSNPTVKGTSLILEAIQRLKLAGHVFNFELLTDVPHSQIKDKMLTADLVIDQLLVGWYGGLSVEAMSLGIPVMCYIREIDLMSTPKELREDLPILRVSSEDLESKLKEALMLNENELKDLQKKSREFVEKWHDPEKIACYLKTFYLTKQ